MRLLPKQGPISAARDLELHLGIAFTVFPGLLGGLSIGEPLFGAIIGFGFFCYFILLQMYIPI